MSIAFISITSLVGSAHWLLIFGVGFANGFRKLPQNDESGCKMIWHWLQSNFGNGAMMASVIVGTTLWAIAIAITASMLKQLAQTAGLAKTDSRETDADDGVGKEKLP